MNTFKISIQRGLMTAPAMIVDAIDDKKAIDVAKKLSGLGRFDSWSFVAIPIRTKRVASKTQLLD